MLKKVYLHTFLFMFVILIIMLTPAIMFSQAHFIGFGYDIHGGNFNHTNWYHSSGLNLRYKIIALALGKNTALGTVFDFDFGVGNYTLEEDKEGLYIDGGFYLSLLAPYVMPNIGVEYFFNFNKIGIYSGLKIPIEFEIIPSNLLYVSLGLGVVPTFLLVGDKGFTIFLTISVRTYIMTIAY